MRGATLAAIALWVPAPFAAAADSDDFDDPGTLSTWTVFTDGPFSDNYYEMLDIDGEVSGHLTFVPGPGHSGWFAHETGGFLYQLVTGNFVADTFVRTMSKHDAGLPPSQEFNSAGLIARNPDTTTGQNYVMINVGMQSSANGIGTETKNTVDSSSQLTLMSDAAAAELRICRVGDVFRMYKRTDGETEWTEINTFTRADLPSTIQIGAITNGWESPPDVRAEFDYVRFGAVLTESDCTAPIGTVVVGEPSEPRSYVRAHPLPARTHVTLQLPATTTADVEVFDSGGRRVDVWHVVDRGTVEWHPSVPPPPGVYFVRVRPTNGMALYAKVHFVR